MKYIHLFIVLLLGNLIFAQTPNIDLGNVSSFLAQSYFGVDGFYIFRPNVLPWRISHGSPDIYKDRDGKIILSAGAAPSSSRCANDGEFSNCSCPVPEACNTIPLALPNKRISQSEGFYYPFDFKRGHKYTISFQYNIGSQGPASTFGIDRIDKIFVVPTNGLPDAMTNEDCGQRCFWLPQWPYEVPSIFTGANDFKPNRQGWFASNLPTSADMTGVAFPFQSASFCFIAENDYSQLWFSCNDLSPNPNSIAASNNDDAVTFNVKDIRIEGECMPTYVYEGGEYRYMSDPGFSTIFPMPVPLATTGVSDNITLQPNRGTVYVASSTASNAGVSLTAGNYIDFKAPISPAANKYIEINYFSNQPSTSNPYEPYSGRTPYFMDIGRVGGFEAKIEPCNGFDSPNACQEYQQWQNQVATPNGSADAYVHNVNRCAGPGNQGPPGLTIWRPIFRNYRKPYNSYEVEWHVFARWGAEVCEGKYRDECNGVPDGIMQCDGCSGGEEWSDDVYTFIIHLTNCHGTISLSGSFTFWGGCLSCSKSLDNATNVIEQDSAMLVESRKTIKVMEEMLLFPNPAAEELTIVFPLEKELESIRHIQVMDVSGSVVKDLQSQGSSSSIERIDISDLTAGSYFIKVQSDVKILTQKFIKI